MESKELNSAFAILQTTSTLLTFIIFIVPGFVFFRVYESLLAGVRQKVNEIVVDIIIFSFVVDAICLPFYSIVIRISDDISRSILLGLIALVGLVALPSGLAIGIFKMKTELALRGMIPDPIKRPWDKFFQTVSAKSVNLGVVVTLTDGTKVGGRFVDHAFASSAPEEEQLLIGQTWKLDNVNDSFLEPIDNSLGFIVDKKDCVLIEFFNWTREESITPVPLNNISES